MMPPEAARSRLAFLLETAILEAEHLQLTDRRLFAQDFTPERAAGLRTDVALAEQLDAFGARFARLQDTAGDKLLPSLLVAIGENVGSALDNLDRACRLGLLAATSETWIAARWLRNRMAHEYVRDPAVLSQAVIEAHALVPMLSDFVTACRDYAAQRRLI